MKAKLFILDTKNLKRAKYQQKNKMNKRNKMKYNDIIFTLETGQTLAD